MAPPSKTTNQRTAPEQNVKSRDRVRDLGEVYTAEREVRAMLDLIPGLTPSQTFLEPACGHGNFLVEILRRKLRLDPVTRPFYEHSADTRPALFPKNGKSEEIMLHAIQAVASIYGFDICQNNVAEARARLYAYTLYGEDLLLPNFLVGKDNHALDYIAAVTPNHELPLAAGYEQNLFDFADKTAKRRNVADRAAAVSPLLADVLKRVLEKNLQQGDYLAQVDLAGQPLTVGQWKFLSGKVRREDFLLSDVGTENPTPVAVLPIQEFAKFVRGAFHE